MNIYQKLIEVRKSCEYLKKDNKGYQFNFVSSSQTLGTLRKAMDDNALLLVPSVDSYEIRDHTTSKGAHEYFTALKMTFTWINAEKPEEKIECQWTGQGLDNGEKGVGKALTYAEKYFLLKFFNIATDKDDPDSKQSKTETKQQPNQQQQQQNSQPDKQWYNDFNSEKEQMQNAINSGKSTSDSIIAFLEKTYKLSKDTRDKIKALTV